MCVWCMQPDSAPSFVFFPLLLSPCLLSPPVAPVSSLCLRARSVRPAVVEPAAAMTDVAASASSKPAHIHPQPVTISFSKQAQAAAALKEKEKQAAAAAGPAATDKPAEAVPALSASPPSPALNGTSYAQAYSAQKEKAAAAAASGAASSSQPPKHGSSSNSSSGASVAGKDSKKLSVVPPTNLALARSRSAGGDSAQVGLSPALSPHAANPHTMPTAAFSPQAPILLEHPWSMFLDDTNLWGVKTVEECLARMGYLGTVDSIQSFWIYFNAFAVRATAHSTHRTKRGQRHTHDGCSRMCVCCALPRRSCSLRPSSAPTRKREA